MSPRPVRAGCGGRRLRARDHGRRGDRRSARSAPDTLFNEVAPRGRGAEQIGWPVVGPPGSSGVGLLPTLLDVGLHELFGVRLEDVVDLLEEIVELGFELLA